MSNQPENENLQTVTPEEVRQSILAEIDATKQAIDELSEEELEEIAGGIGLSVTGLRDHLNAYGDYYHNLGQSVKGIGSSIKGIGSSIKGIYDTRSARRMPMEQGPMGPDPMGPVR